MFDKINEEKAIYERKMRIGFTISIVAFVLFIPAGMSAGPLGGFLMMIPFMGGAIYSGNQSKKIKEISVNFKKEYLEKELVKFFPYSEYKPYDGFKEKEVVYSNLLFERDRYYSEDLIMGNFEGVNFRCSDVKQQDVRKSGKTTKVVTVFHGRFYEFDFHKSFKYDLLLLQPLNFRPFSGFRKIETESIEFNSDLKIYAKDDHEAFYILTPDFMEKIRYLDEKYFDKISFSFKDNKLFIAIDSRKDYFDIKAYKKVDESLIKEYQEEFQDIKDFITILNLNSTLFK
jgi:hypothetical protein